MKWCGRLFVEGNFSQGNNVTKPRKNLNRSFKIEWGYKNWNEKHISFYNAYLNEVEKILDAIFVIRIVGFPGFQP